MNTEWIATEWQRGDQLDGFQQDPVTIHRLVSPFFEGERFAVRCQGRVLSTSGQWRHEPQPSSRTPAFYKRCRFNTFIEARLAADVAINRGR